VKAALGWGQVRPSRLICFLISGHWESQGPREIGIPVALCRCMSSSAIPSSLPRPDQKLLDRLRTRRVSSQVEELAEFQIPDLCEGTASDEPLPQGLAQDLAQEPVKAANEESADAGRLPNPWAEPNPWTDSNPWARIRTLPWTPLAKHKPKPPQHYSSLEQEFFETGEDLEAVYEYTEYSSTPEGASWWRRLCARIAS